MKSLFRTFSVPHFIVLTVLVFTLSCAGPILPKRKVFVQPPPKTTAKKKSPEKAVTPSFSSLEEKQLFNQAEKAHDQVLLPEALGKYQEFLETYPNSALNDQARFSIGQIRERLGQYELAVAAYQELLLKNPKSIFVPEAQYRFLVLLIKTNNYNEAIEIINSLLDQTTKPEELAWLYYLAGQAEAGRLDRGRALNYYNMAYNLTEDPSDKLDARSRILGILMSMPLQELIQTKAEYGQEFPAGYISYFTAYRSFRAGRVHEAQLELNEFSNTFPGHELTEQARLLQRAITNQGPPPPLVIPGTRRTEKHPEPSGEEELTETINPASDFQSSDMACLMPLSGSASKYGQKVVKGLRLAFKLYSPQTEDFKSNLIILDSGSDSDQTIQAIDRLASQTEVLAVIGPLTTKVSEIAAIRAEELALPMITLSQKAGLPQIGGHIFRVFLTPEAQARAVAEYAVQILGLTRLAILHPEDDYGNKMRDVFWDEVNRLRAEVVGVQPYPPNTTDFSRQIQKLSGVEKVERRVEAGHAVEVNFEAVFIPDGYKAVAMITPQFFYHDITTIRLLGTTLWHTPRLLTTASRYIQKSIIPTSFFANNDRPEVKQFVEAFQQENEGETPGRFEAYGYDAGMLILSLMDKAQVYSREDLVRALSNLKNFSGVTGNISFTSDGELKTNPALLTVVGKRFKLIQ
ncbi:MAG: penicillin-binding protein activator [Deltaproteobacteria bacterium]|nr:penicillin-binding protein activator [Deltaproteobacteria bacterium]MBW2323538.1 penicillin-binding protein activator [Deltaproteobacteria bacterium]